MIRAISEAVPEPKITIEIVTDPVEIARSKAQHEQHLLNSHWLASHWHTLLPQARGKYVAVAGQEATIADSPKEAWDWAVRTHPEDKGAVIQYIYANRW